MADESNESPLDDLTYDLVTILREKGKALRAYDRYLSDAEDDEEARDLLVELRRQDEDSVRALKEVLARRLDEDLGYVEEDEEDFEDFQDDDEDEEGLDASSGPATGRSESGAPPPRSGGSMPDGRGDSTRRRT